MSVKATSVAFTFALKRFCLTSAFAQQIKRSALSWLQALHVMESRYAATWQLPVFISSSNLVYTQEAMHRLCDTLHIQTCRAQYERKLS